MVIYKITNKINGKCYIGQTVRSLSRRWTEHKDKSSGCLGLFKAIQKYGKDNFTIEEITSYTNMEDLNNAEEYFIEYYNCLAPNGYNLHTGGNVHKVSEETKIKLSEARQREWDSGKGNGFKPGHEFKGKRKHSIETINKIKHIQNNRTEEHKKNLIGVGFKKGHKHSAETLKKLSSYGHKQIKCISTGEIYSSLTEAAVELQLHISGISACLRKVRPHTKGYKFEYVR